MLNCLIKVLLPDDLGITSQLATEEATISLPWWQRRQTRWWCRVFTVFPFLSQIYCISHCFKFQTKILLQIDIGFFWFCLIVPEFWPVTSTRFWLLSFWTVTQNLNFKISIWPIINYIYVVIGSYTLTHYLGLSTNWAYFDPFYTIRLVDWTYKSQSYWWSREKRGGLLFDADVMEEYVVQ